MKRRSANRLFLGGSLVGLITIAALPFAGWLHWVTKPERTVDLLVYDSTVFEPERRQHNAVGLMMKYLKVPFEADADYVGSLAGGLPFGVWPDEAPDLVLLVDAYGVYVNEQADVDPNGTIRITPSFPRNHAIDIVDWASQGTVVMGEFNMMHEPTDPGTSEVLQGLFGVDATGWTGRAFENLQDVSPRLQEIYGQPWGFTGPGLVLIGASVGDHRQDGVVLVLGPDELTSLNPEISGESLLGSDATNILYDSWFALIQAQSGADTVLWIDLPVNDRGAAILDEWGIAKRSPFLVWNDNTVYAAGNLASTPAAFPARRISGALAVLERLPFDDNVALFYRVYAPVVARLVEMADETSR